MLNPEKTVCLCDLVVSRWCPNTRARAEYPKVGMHVHTFLFLQFGHHLVSAVLVHNASNTEGRHDTAHTRKAAGKPVNSDFGEALLESCPAVAVVQIEAHEVERRRDELDCSRRQELRSRGAGDVALHSFRQR
jgi:hypothetical protein